MCLDRCIACCHSLAKSWWKLEPYLASPLNVQMHATSRALVQRLVQELKDALQQQQVTQQAAACAEEQAHTALRHQQEHAEENAALKHEIQVQLNLIVLITLCGRGRELANNAGAPRELQHVASTSGRCWQGLVYCTNEFSWCKHSEHHHDA